MNLMYRLKHALQIRCRIKSSSLVTLQYVALKVYSILQSDRGLVPRTVVRNECQYPMQLRGVWFVDIVVVFCHHPQLKPFKVLIVLLIV